MPMTKQDDLYEDVAKFNNAVFSTLVLAAVKRQLSEDEVHLLHRSADLKLRIDDLAGI
jgi:hypothetical protein